MRGYVLANLDPLVWEPRRYPELDVIASGGVSSLEDLRALREISVAATVVGKALYEERFGLAEALRC